MECGNSLAAEPHRDELSPTPIVTRVISHHRLAVEFHKQPRN